MLNDLDHIGMVYGLQRLNFQLESGATIPILEALERIFGFFRIGNISNPADLRRI